VGEYFLKNPTGALITINDLGRVIDSNESITIDENDFDGFLTPDMVTALNSGLVLSTTDIGTTSGDFPTAIAIERLTLKSRWKPSVETFNNLPLIGNEDGDIRLVEDIGMLFWWNLQATEWTQLTSTFSLTVEEYDANPSGTDIQKLVFVEAEDDVYIDADNNIAYIGPPDPPLSLHGQDLTIEGTTFYIGNLSQNNINYKTGDIEGSTISYIVKDGTFTLKTPIGNYSDQGEKGIISIFHNGIAIATIDLEANFNVLNNDSAQDLSTYDIQGNGDAIINATVSLTYGYFEVLHVGKFNNFKFYQSWHAQFVLTDATALRQGWNEFYITHEDLASGTQISNTVDIFYDTDAGSNPSNNVPTVVENVPVINWLSGVQFYDTGSTWNISTIVLDAFDNVYHSSNAPIILNSWPGMVATPLAYTDSSVVGVSSPPNIDEIMTVTDWQLVQAANYMNLDAQLDVTPRDPYGSYTPQTSLSENIMVYSFGSYSTPLKEYFRDEDYRMLSGDYDTIPANIVAQWDSTQSLDTYDAGNQLQVFMDELIFPHEDFTNTLPGGNPNYSPLGVETNKYYFRAFKDTTLSRAQGTLRITGVTKQQMLDEDIKVWIKVPSQTGWLSLNTDYNYATFTGIDEDGCWMHRDMQTNSDFTFGLDRFRTEFGGYMIIVKVMIPSNTGIKISHMEVIDW